MDQVAQLFRVRPVNPYDIVLAAIRSLLDKSLVHITSEKAQFDLGVDLNQLA